MKSTLSRLERLFAYWAPTFCMLGVFALPLRLSVANFFLVPLVIWGILLLLLGKFPKPMPIILPLYFWLLVGMLSAPFGLGASKSLCDLISFGGRVLLIGVYFKVVQENGYLRFLYALIGGQALASMHSVFEVALPWPIPSLFVGKVSESGQIMFTLMVIIGCLFGLLREKLSRVEVLALISAGVLVVAAFIVNMKRGPWFGFSVALSIFLMRLKPRWVLPFVAGVVAIGCFVSPIRQRLLDSYAHFEMTGGRAVMWETAMDLAAKYPLGIGYDKSKLLPVLVPEVPKTLTHFHSNYLNILVETGWMGLMAFLWWIISIVNFSLRKLDRDSQHYPVALAIGLSFLGSHLAGFVEYNFGDSEVVLLSFILLGVFSALETRKATT